MINYFPGHYINNKLILYGLWATKELSNNFIMNNNSRWRRHSKWWNNGQERNEKREMSMTVLNWNEIVNSIYWIHSAAASNWYLIRKYWYKFTRFIQYSAALHCLHERDSRVARELLLVFLRKSLGSRCKIAEHCLQSNGHWQPRASSTLCNALQLYFDSIKPIEYNWI